MHFPQGLTTTSPFKLNSTSFMIDSCFIDASKATSLLKIRLNFDKLIDSTLCLFTILMAKYLLDLKS
jgi:hypothetical protein